MRVMVSHNGQTRYIPTDIIIDSISEFKEGRVVKRPDKDILNLRLKKYVINILRGIWNWNSPIA